jgi:sporulation-control protein spo0M
MLASISEALFAQGLSVEHVHTSLRPGAGGRLDFVSEIDCVMTSYMDHEEIREMVYNLSKLKELHHLDICDVRVQRLMVPVD